MSTFETDNELVKRIRNGDEALLRKLYKVYAAEFKGYMIKRFNCDRQEVLALYQDAFSVMWQNIHEGKLVEPLSSKLQTYVIGIGKILKMRELDKNKRILDESFITELESSFTIASETAGVRIWITKILQKIGEPCASLLQQRYEKGWEFEIIGEEIDIETGTARKRHFDCIRKIRKLIETDPDLNPDLYL